MMYRMETEYLPTGLSAFSSTPNPPLSDLTQYINPHVKNNRVQNAIGNHITGFRKPSKPDTYKTVMCQAWLESMSCKFGETCKFAHGEAELRPAKVPIRNHLKYKTRPCMKYLAGLCPFGVRCLFIHDPNFSAPQVPQVSQMPQVKPESTTFASIIGSGGSSPTSIAASWDRPISPMENPLQSIWASDQKILKSQQPRQQKFNMSGGPQRTPSREVFGANLLQEVSVDETGAPLPFNKTAEAMVSFLWA